MPREPLVSQSILVSIARHISQKAMVTMATYRPLSFSVGRPTRMPHSPVTTPPARRVTPKPQPSLVARMAAVYAPIPKKPAHPKPVIPI